MTDYVFVLSIIVSLFPFMFQVLRCLNLVLLTASEFGGLGWLKIPSMAELFIFFYFFFFCKLIKKSIVACYMSAVLNRR